MFSKKKDKQRLAAAQRDLDQITANLREVRRIEWAEQKARLDAHLERMNADREAARQLLRTSLANHNNEIRKLDEALSQIRDTASHTDTAARSFTAQRWHYETIYYSDNNGVQIYTDDQIAKIASPLKPWESNPYTIQEEVLG